MGLGPHCFNSDVGVLVDAKALFGISFFSQYHNLSVPNNAILQFLYFLNFKKKRVGTLSPIYKKYF
jgi:hypothetical protein